MLPTDVMSHARATDGAHRLTRYLLLTITSHSTDDRVLFAADAVHSALDVALGLGGLVFGLALGVLLLSGLLPRLGAGEVADRLDGRALHGVVLAGGLAAKMERKISTSSGREIGERKTYLGSPLLL